MVLLWVNNHFTDFEMDPVMMNFLEQFEEGLEREKMAGQLRLLDFACATKARARTVTLTRPSRDEILHFSILGGYERGFGIFISKVCRRYWTVPTLVFVWCKLACSFVFNLYLIIAFV